MSEDLDLLASRYALGNLDLDEMLTAERLMATDPAFADRVELWSERWNGFEDRPPAAVEPSPGLWGRIAAGIARIEASPDTVTIKPDDLAWLPFSPGIWQKILFADPLAGTQNVLVKMSPGSTVPPHAHGVNEECLVLEGTIDVDGIAIAAGQLHVALQGTVHSPIHSASGALLYIRTAMDAGA